MQWTHGSPLTAGRSDHWLFMDTEVWGPHWSTCVREDAAPDVFIRLAERDPSVDERYDQALLLALHVSLVDRLREAVPRSVLAAAKLCNSVLIASQRTPWAEPFGDSGFTESIQDYLWRVVSPRHATEVAEERLHVAQLHGDWRQIG